MLVVMTNRGINRFAVEILAVQVGNQVLEIDFGPGAGTAMLAGRATKGLVADLTSTMVAQASARNRATVQNGCMELKVGSLSAIRILRKLRQGLQRQQHFTSGHRAATTSVKLRSRYEKGWHPRARVQN